MEKGRVKEKRKKIMKVKKRELKRESEKDTSERVCARKRESVCIIKRNRE